MGESRCFAAHGARSHDGHGRDAWARPSGQAPDLYDDAAWQDAQWAGHQGSYPDPYGSAPPHGEFNPASAGAHPRGYELPHPAYAPHPAQPHPAQHDDQGYSRSDPRAYASAPATSAPPVSLTAVAQGVGAVLSLALLVGGGVWTWQMMQRDVSGVPVVRALDGPLRVAPDDPGGTQAAHQGLSVTELAADGATDLPDEIVLAPAPLDLKEDLGSTANAGRSETPQQEMLIEIGLPAPEADEIAEADPLGLVRPNRYAVTRSPRPAPRSAGGAAVASRPSDQTDEADSALAAAIANSVAADLSGGRSVDVDPASIGPGTRLVQLGTYESAADARRAWDGLVQRFNPLLDDRGRVIEAAHSGGSVFYRLRAHGFSDERDARRFCAALIDQRLDCIPVLIR